MIAIPLIWAAALVATAGAVAAQDGAAPAHIVHFAIDRAAFDAEGIDTLTRASRAAMGDGFASIVVSGHTDTLGDSAYNRDLSARRARTIAEELIARGVPRSAVSQTFHGQSSPVVATGDGVAEAANRRVEISMSGAGTFAPPDPDRPIRFPTP